MVSEIKNLSFLEKQHLVSCFCSLFQNQSAVSIILEITFSFLKKLYPAFLNYSDWVLPYALLVSSYSCIVYFMNLTNYRCV